MKLPKGKSILIGNKTYSGELPDKLVTEEVKANLKGKTLKPEKKEEKEAK